MPTRRDLHEQARAAQRHQLQAAQVANPKSAIVGIGKRDPQTGLFSVALPDGSTEIGEKQFNSSLPEGSQVLGIPKDEGGWVLDERDAVVSPAPTVVDLAPSGIIMWLDCNWLFLDGVPPQAAPGGLEVLYALLHYFRIKKIYTLPTNDSRIYRANRGNLGERTYSLDDPPIAAGLAQNNITVVHTSIETAKGAFFLPMLNSDAALTPQEFSALRAQARTHGVLICGEFSDWELYDDRLLRGLQIRSEVTIVRVPTLHDDYKLVGKGFPKLNLRGSGHASFGGLKHQEVLVIDQANAAVFAYFKKL